MMGNKALCWFLELQIGYVSSAQQNSSCVEAVVNREWKEFEVTNRAI